MRYRKMVRHKKKVMAGVGVATTLTAPAAALAENPVESIVGAVTPDAPQIDNTVSREAPGISSATKLDNSAPNAWT